MRAHQIRPNRDELLQYRCGRIQRAGKSIEPAPETKAPKFARAIARAEFGKNYVLQSRGILILMCVRQTRSICRSGRSHDLRVVDQDDHDQLRELEALEFRLGQIKGDILARIGAREAKPAIRVVQ